MFICKDCHAKTACTALHIFESRGRCEVCGKIKKCYDCHYHKDVAEERKLEKRLQAYRKRAASRRN